jgi:hypothetical protein
LISQRLDLVVGVEQHLSKFSHAQLKVGVVLEQVSHKVTDGGIPTLGILQRLGRSSALETASSRIEMFLDLALTFHPFDDFGMSIALLTCLNLHPFQLILHVHDPTLGFLEALGVRSRIFPSANQILLKFLLFLFQQR